MKITKLISIFKRLLPLYKEAYNDDWSREELVRHKLHCGICLASDYELLDLFTNTDGYYINLVDNNSKLSPYPNTGKDLKSRIDFVESEIKSLERLQKRGYTHV